MRRVVLFLASVIFGTCFLFVPLASADPLETATDARLENTATVAPSDTAPVATSTLTPFTPQLSVPIPGVQFTTPTIEGGNVSVPFLAQYITGAYRYALGVVTIIAIIMVIYGGFQYLLGETIGDVKTGKMLIMDALMGMALLFGAYFILYNLNPNLASLEALNLSTVRSVPMSIDSFADSLARDQEAGETSAAPGASGVAGQGPRSLCRENLVPQAHHGSGTAWCSACGGCREVSTGRPDAACEAIIGGCGGGLGQYLDAVTHHCRAKTFGWLETLDGGTFGILHYTADNLPGLMTRLQQKDPAAYARVIAAGGGVQVSTEAICASNRNDRGFICNQGYRNLLQAALRERSFTLVQLGQVYDRYNRIRGLAQSWGFQSAYGQAMVATMLNNPGACGGSLAPLRQRCTQSDESQKIECFLREFVAVPCRGNATGAANRVASIREALANVSRSQPPVVKTLQEVEACVR